MTGPSLNSRKVCDIIDMLATVRHLNYAIFMAADSPSVTGDATNAIQSIGDVIDSKLDALMDRLDELREELA